MSRRILIVDDEAPARLRLRRYFETAHPSFVLEEAGDGFEALEKINAFYPDLVFLDVEMPELTGFDVIAHVTDRFFQVIFQTAYDEFALRAFEVNACDYLLKPYPDHRLELSVTRALARAAEPSLDKLKGGLLKSGLFLERFVVRLGSRSKRIEPEAVICFESRDHYTYLHTGSSSYLYDYPLNYLEERLNGAHFFRSHRNGIVRLAAVREFKHQVPRSVTLTNGIVLPVSRNRASPLRELLEAPQ